MEQLEKQDMAEQACESPTYQKGYDIKLDGAHFVLLLIIYPQNLLIHHLLY